MADLPVPKNPVNTAIEKSIEEAGITGRHYGDKLFGPGLDEGSGIIRDEVSLWRMKHKINLLLRAKKWLEERGIEPRHVLPKVGLAILDGVSVEGDENLRERFAALLINAANPGFQGQVRPSFAKILADLSPDEAKFLDGLYKVTLAHGRTESIRIDSSGPVRAFVVLGGTIRDQPAMPDGETDTQVMLDELIRLGLLHAHHAARNTSGIVVTYPIYNHVRLTPMGMAFMRACTLEES
jgi:hypothetical protein